ncbi:MAG: autotransporter-associated beta strand repeat-containing protein [Kiritimatiellia bacterium]
MERHGFDHVGGDNAGDQKRRRHLTFSGNSSYAGPTVVNAGTLRLNHVNGAGTGAMTLGNATLSLYRSGATTTYGFNGLTAQAGTSGLLVVDGSGSNAGTGTNATYSLGTVSVAGTLTVARPAGGTGHTIFSGLLAGGGTLVIENTNGGTAPGASAIGRANFSSSANTFNGSLIVRDGGNFLNSTTNPSYTSAQVDAGDTSPSWAAARPPPSGN